MRPPAPSLSAVQAPPPPPTPRRDIAAEPIRSTAAQRLGARRPRSPSPEWDIELDLNEDDNDDMVGESASKEPQRPPWEREEARGVPEPQGKGKEAERHYSPDWDLRSGDDEEEL